MTFEEGREFNKAYPSENIYCNISSTLLGLQVLDFNDWFIENKNKKEQSIKFWIDDYSHLLTD